MKRRSLAAVAALSLVLAACGDDDAEPAGAAVTEPAAGAAVTEPAADATTPPAGGGGRGDYADPVDETPAPATDAPAGDDAGGGAEIVISGFEFSEGITVPVGTTVIVRNDDSVAHTVTADDGSFDSGRIDGGSTGEVTLTAAGTFTFHCELHPAMSGTITVTA
jgi:plastocyanin